MDIDIDMNMYNKLNINESCDNSDLLIHPATVKKIDIPNKLANTGKYVYQNVFLFSSNDNFFGYINERENIYIYNIFGNLINIIRNYNITSACMSADNIAILADNIIYIIDYINSNIIYKYDTIKYNYRSITYNNTNSLLACAFDDGIEIYDNKNHNSICTGINKRYDSGFSIKFSPNDLYIITTGNDCQPHIFLWDAKKGNHISTFGYSLYGYNDIIFTPDSTSIIASCWYEGKISIWDINEIIKYQKKVNKIYNTGINDEDSDEEDNIKNKLVKKYDKEHSTSKVALSKSGKYIAYVENSQDISYIHIYEYMFVKLISSHKFIMQNDEIYDIHFSNCEQMLLCQLSNNDVFICKVFV